MDLGLLGRRNLFPNLPGANHIGANNFKLFRGNENDLSYSETFAAVLSLKVTPYPALAASDLEVPAFGRPGESDSLGEAEPLLCQRASVSADLAATCPWFPEASGGTV